MSAKLQIRLGQGQKGVTLDVLSNIVGETKKFIDQLGYDLKDSQSSWIAKNFRDGSVIFEIECSNQEPSAVDRWRRGLKTVCTGSFEDDDMNVLVSRATRSAYAKVVRSIPENQKIEFGFFSNGDESPSEYITQTREDAETLAPEAKREPVNYFGEIQGIVHAFYKEADPKYFVVRELSTSFLIKCFFPSDMYLTAIQALEDENGVIFIEGQVKETAEGKIIEIQVENFTLAPVFDEPWFKQHIGAFPDSLTGCEDPSVALTEFRQDA